MSTHCDDLIPALVRAAEGSLDVLPADERARLQAHLATCASCAEALADQTSMRNALTMMAAEPVNTFVGSRVMANLRSEGLATTWLESLDWKRWTWRLVPVAAALAIAVGSVAATSTNATGTTEETDPTDATSTTYSMPASSTLVTGEVDGNDLLTLLLNSSADTAVVTQTTSGGGAQ
jgi:anti-sigma factor RsiW